MCIIHGVLAVDGKHFVPTITTVQTCTDNGPGTFVLSKSLHPKLNFHFYGTSRWLKIKGPGKGVGSLSHKEVVHCVSWLSESHRGAWTH